MFRTKVSVRSFCILLFLLICAEVPLKAYADPGSGILIWQLLAAGFVGVMFRARKIASWFRSRKRG